MWSKIGNGWNTFSILSLHPSLGMEADSPSSSYISKRAVKNEYQSYLANISQNIARIANAVQVTICLLVSTSVY